MAGSGAISLTDTAGTHVLVRPSAVENLDLEGYDGDDTFNVAANRFGTLREDLTPVIAIHPLLGLVRESGGDPHRLEHVVQLDERAADIIRSRYGLVDGRQHKLADIGAKHGISAERVRQLEREALQKLRTLADPDLAA